MKTKFAAEQSIDRYMSEINRYPLLSRDEEFALAERYSKNGDLQAAHQLVVSNLRFVVKVAHEYRGYGYRLLDLIQEGNIGLMLAVKKFEPKRGYRLISYAVWWIRAYIQNFVIRSWSLIKVGTTQAQRKLFFKLRSERERADRQAGTGKTALSSELARRLKVTENDIEDMEGRLSARDFSLDAAIDDGARQTHQDLLPDESANQEHRLATAEERSSVRKQVRHAMKAFNAREVYVVEHRLMADEPATLQDIGTHFQVSRERARQIEGNVIKKLRTVLQDNREALRAA